jgi:hypothetical protein
MLLQKRQILIATLLVLCVVSAACDKNKITEAKRAAFRIQVVTDAAVDTTSAMFERGTITPTQTKTIAQALLKVNHANRILIDKAAAMTEDTAENRAALVVTVRQISDAIKELKATGILGIKNPDSSLAFDSTIRALDVALAAIEVALSGGN